MRLSYLPHRALAWLIYRLTLATKLVLRRVRANVARYLPDRDADEQARIVDGFYNHFGKYFVEELHLRWISPKRLRAGMKIANIELLDQLFADGRKVLVTSAHVGNLDWFWLTLSERYRGLNLAMVANDMETSWFDRYLHRNRIRFGHRQIMNTDVAREIMVKRQVPDLLGLVPDLSPEKTQSSETWPFLGDEKPFVRALPRLADRLGLTVVYADLRRHGYADYRCQLSVIGTPPYADKAAQVQADYVKMVETAVQDQPETWLAWAMVVV